MIIAPDGRIFEVELGAEYVDVELGDPAEGA